MSQPVQIRSAYQWTQEIVMPEHDGRTDGQRLQSAASFGKDDVVRTQNFFRTRAGLVHSGSDDVQFDTGLLAGTA